MEDKYYNAENCKELGAEISGLIDTIKYLYSLSPESTDKKYLTPELIEEFAGVVSSCKDLISAFEYYSKKV